MPDILPQRRHGGNRIAPLNVETEVEADDVARRHSRGEGQPTARRKKASSRRTSGSGSARSNGHPKCRMRGTRTPQASTSARSSSQGTSPAPPSTISISNGRPGVREGAWRRARGRPPRRGGDRGRRRRREVPERGRRRVRRDARKEGSRAGARRGGRARRRAWRRWRRVRPA